MVKNQEAYRKADGKANRSLRDIMGLSFDDFTSQSIRSGGRYLPKTNGAGTVILTPGTYGSTIHILREGVGEDFIARLRELVADSFELYNVAQEPFERNMKIAGVGGALGLLVAMLPRLRGPLKLLGLIPVAVAASAAWLGRGQLISLDRQNELWWGRSVTEGEIVATIEGDPQLFLKAELIDGKAQRELCEIFDGTEDSSEAMLKAKTYLKGLESRAESKAETKPSQSSKAQAKSKAKPSKAKFSAELSKLTVPQLKDRLREHGLKVGGRKEELIDRLVDFTIQNR